MKKEPKYPRGTKVVLEVGEIHTHYDDNGTAYNLYRMKGFRSLFLDDRGMEIAMKQNKVEYYDPVMDIKLMLEKEEAEMWFKEMVNTKRLLRGLSDKNKNLGFRACVAGFDNELHIYDGIRKLAELLGEEIHVETVNRDGYVSETLFFFHNGIYVFQLGEKE